MQTSVKNSNFDCVHYCEYIRLFHLLYYKCHKINFKQSRLYIDSLDWIKNKEPTINHINKKDNENFQHAVTVALNH